MREVGIDLMFLIGWKWWKEHDRWCVSKIKDDLHPMEDDFDMMEDNLVMMEDDQNLLFPLN